MMMSINACKRFSLALFLSLALLLGGCASMSMTRLPEGSFRLEGANYLPLVDLCSKYDIEWEWDSFTQTITLKKEDNIAKFLIDSPVVLINGELEIINPPARFYKGSLVVPLIFKEKVIKELIKSKPTKTQGKSFDYKRYKIKRVVIDPGHGGKDPGAIGNSGVKEKDINLDIARRLKELLEDKGIKAIMTRDRDTFVSLKKRIDITNRSSADFFISIHANANRSKRLSGFEIYYFTEEAGDVRRAQLAAKRNSSEFNDKSMDQSSKDLKVILWDMIYTENQAESIRLAKNVSLVSSKELSTDNRGLKLANFYVLKNSQIPSILIEVGYLSNPQEEKKIRDADYRQNIADMLAKAILGN